MSEVETKSLPANAYQPLAPEETYQPVVPAEAKLPELTWRSVGWGVLLCVIFTVASAYSGLKVGQVMESAIPISILTIGLARVYRRRSTVLENVITTGIGGVAGSVVAGALHPEAGPAPGADHFHRRGRRMPGHALPHPASPVFRAGDARDAALSGG